MFTSGESTATPWKRISEMLSDWTGRKLSVDSDAFCILARLFSQNFSYSSIFPQPHYKKKKNVIFNMLIKTDLNYSANFIVY